VGDQGAVSLAAGIGRLRPGLLAELHLRNTGIGSAGMAALFGALLGQRNLLLLDVTANEVGADAGAALGAALRVTTKLEKLLLGGTRIAAATAFTTLPPGAPSRAASESREREPRATFPFGRAAVTDPMRRRPRLASAAVLATRGRGT